MNEVEFKLYVCRIGCGGFHFGGLTPGSRWSRKVVASDRNGRLCCSRGGTRYGLRRWLILGRSRNRCGRRFDGLQFAIAQSSQAIPVGALRVVQDAGQFAFVILHRGSTFVLATLRQTFLSLREQFANLCLLLVGQFQHFCEVTVRQSTHSAASNLHLPQDSSLLDRKQCHSQPF